MIISGDIPSNIELHCKNTDLEKEKARLEKELMLSKERTENIDWQFKKTRTQFEKMKPLFAKMKEYKANIDRLTIELDVKTHQANRIAMEMLADFERETDEVAKRAALKPGNKRSQSTKNMYFA